jgi:hypothetical protein
MINVTQPRCAHCGAPMVLSHIGMECRDCFCPISDDPPFEFIQLSCIDHSIKGKEYLSENAQQFI